MSMIGNDLLNQNIIEKGITKPSEILNNLHKGVQFALQQTGHDASATDGMDIALCHIDLDKNLLQFAGAHRSLHIIRKENKDEVEVVKANKIGIGGIENIDRDFTNHEISLEKGDSFYLFSDGYTDQFGGPNYQKYSSKKFRKFLLGIQNLNMAEQLESLEDELRDWRMSMAQTDDITVIGVRI